MKENNVKTLQLKVRVSPVEKEVIDRFCSKNGMTVSDFLRLGISKVLLEDER